MFPSGSAPAKIYGTFKMQKLTDSDFYPNLQSSFSFVGTSDYNLAHVIFSQIILMNNTVH